MRPPTSTPLHPTQTYRRVVYTNTNNSVTQQQKLDLHQHHIAIQEQINGHLGMPVNINVKMNEMKYGNN